MENTTRIFTSILVNLSLYLINEVVILQKMILFSISLLSAFLLFGCNFNDGDRALNNRDVNNVQRVRYNNENVGIPNVTNNRNDLTDVNREETRMEVADDSSDRIANMKEVDTANVIVTNRNAYVAVILENDTKDELTDDLEKKIADQVRAEDPDIRNVFVSTNPDFVDRMTDYTRRVSEGEPVEGFFEEFNETVRRVFPTNR